MTRSNKLFLQLYSKQNYFLHLWKWNLINTEFRNIKNKCWHNFSTFCVTLPVKLSVHHEQHHNVLLLPHFCPRYEMWNQGDLQLGRNPTRQHHETIQLWRPSERMWWLGQDLSNRQLAHRWPERNINLCLLKPAISQKCFFLFQLLF